LAETRQDELMGVVRGFMESRILLTAAELDLFTLLAGRPMRADEVCKEIGGDLRAVTILLDALCAIGWLRKADGIYSTQPETAEMLAAGAPEGVLPIILHYANMWKRWSRLTDIVRGAPSEEPAVATRTPEQFRAFIEGMHVLARRRAPAVVAQVGVGEARALLDVGGASGTYTIAFLRAAPAMRATLFDLPNVVDMARERLAGEGLLDRVTLVGGDYLKDPIPGSHDLAFLSAIIHQNSPEENVALYRKCHDAMVSGGRIVIRDHLMSDDRTSPRFGAVFAVNMLCGTSGGNSYTFAEIAQGLEQAGFVNPRIIHEDSVMDGLVEATKP
jgi:predicted O-methyltransferase YrrM